MNLSKLFLCAMLAAVGLGGCGSAGENTTATAPSSPPARTQAAQPEKVNARLTALSASPSTVSVGQSITVTATASAYERIRFNYRDPNYNYFGPTDVYADYYGKARYTFTANLAGYYYVTASDPSGMSSGVYTQALAGPTPTPTPTPASVTLTASASSVQLGQTVTFTARNAYPYGYVRIGRTDPYGSTTTYYAYPDSAGTATYTWTATTPTGAWSFRATDDLGKQSGSVSVNVGSSPTPTPSPSPVSGQNGTLSSSRTSIGSPDRYIPFTFQGAPNTAQYIGWWASGQAAQYRYMGVTDSTGRLSYSFDIQTGGVYTGSNSFWASTTSNYSTGVRSNAVSVQINY